jgi:hypothetical protein
VTRCAPTLLVALVAMGASPASAQAAADAPAPPASSAPDAPQGADEAEDNTEAASAANADPDGTAEDAAPAEETVDDAPPPANEDAAADDKTPAEPAAKGETEPAPPASDPAGEGAAAPDATATEPSAELCEAVLKKKAEADAAAAAAAAAERKKGFWWDKSLTVGATGLGVFNRTFVGQPDGLSATVGAFLKGNVTLGYAGHIFENKLSIQEALVVTPSGDTLLKNPVPLVNKSTDEVIASSEYRFLWQRFPYVGPYVRGQVQTRLLPTFFMRGDQQAVVFRDRDGSVRRESITPYQPFFFAGAFEPTTLSEGAGIHIEPPTFGPWVTYSFKTGVQTSHLLAGNGYVVADDDATEEIELNQLSIVNSAGATAEAALGGQVFDNVVWGLAAKLYYPILALGGNVDELSLVERTHLDAQATVSFKVTKWLSLDAQARVLREPFILNDWQLQATGLITAGFNIL